MQLPIGTMIDIKLLLKDSVSVTGVTPLVIVMLLLCAELCAELCVRLDRLFCVELDKIIVYIEVVFDLSEDTSKLL